ncbi:MAG TPA: NADH-quinone oxidoreductase subunit NuoK [Candidatus Dormibacteraeota bacterium]
MTVGAGHLLAVSATLFAIGVFGLLSRRSLAGVLMALVLMVTASSIALVGFARFGYNDARPLSGMSFALLVSVVLSAEVALGVALVLLLNRRRGGTDVDDLDGPSAAAELTS